MVVEVSPVEAAPVVEALVLPLVLEIEQAPFAVAIEPELAWVNREESTTPDLKREGLLVEPAIILNEPAVVETADSLVVSDEHLMETASDSHEVLVAAAGY